MDNSIIKIHERLATLEAGQAYGNKAIDEVKEMLSDHIQSESGLSEDLIASEAKAGTYRKITWANLTLIVAAAAKVLWPT